MSFEFIKKLPTPEEIRNQYPIDAELQALKTQAAGTSNFQFFFQNAAGPLPAAAASGA